MDNWTLKFDMHTNLGLVPKTKKLQSNEIYISPEVLAKFLNQFKITHTVVLYTDYNELEMLNTLTPNTTIYGLKWIDDIDLYIKDPIRMDIGKPLWRGVKFHSHRCIRFDKKLGEKVYGLDYGDRHTIQKILDHLPDNSIICMHTQGSASLENNATPRAVYTHAMNYPNLKFIISHMGCYGKSSFAPADRFFPRVTRKDMNDKYKLHNNLIKINSFSEMLIADAVYLANKTENVYLNTSILYNVKRKALNECDKWGIGSDFPFTDVSVDRWDEHSYDRQLALAKNYAGEEKANLSHQRTLNWIDLDVTKVPEKKWITFFSRSGSEILKLAEELGRWPDIIFTSKGVESLKKTELYQRAHDEGVGFIRLTKDLRVKDIKQIFEDLNVRSEWDVITLHGYLRIIPAGVCRKYHMVNLHPGLITRYPELKGLDPQKRVHSNILSYKYHGCVLHEVIGQVDEGRVIDHEEEFLNPRLTLDQVFDRKGDMAIELWKRYLTENL